MAKAHISACIEQKLLNELDEFAASYDGNRSRAVEELLAVGLRCSKPDENSPLSARTQIEIINAALKDLDLNSGGKIRKLLTSPQKGFLSFKYFIAIFFALVAVCAVCLLLSQQWM